MRKLDKLLEIFGSYMGVLGAFLVASNSDFSKYGFLLFFASSVALTVFSYREKMTHLRNMQLVFMGINALGIYRWFI